MTEFELWYIQFVHFPTTVDCIGFIILLFMIISAVMYIVIDGIMRSVSGPYPFKYIALQFLTLTFVLSSLIFSIMINYKTQYVFKQINLNLQHINQMLGDTNKILEQNEYRLQQIIKNRSR